MQFSEVQAGARVSQILAELQKHNLTLENFSSITETQKSPGQLHAGTELVLFEWLYLHLAEAEPDSRNITQTSRKHLFH